MKKILLFAIFSIIVFKLSAQTFAPFKADVIENGKTLRNPFVGGLNAPQLSDVDLNKDGIKDLFIFDRVGNVVLTFINKGKAGSVDYDYAPQYEASFPKMMNWVLLRDYDNDGAMDIFTFSDDAFGMICFKGFWVANQLKFKLLVFHGLPFNIMNYDTYKDEKANIYISDQDYPAVDDVDSDGDMDIVTFRSNGGYVEYYKNVSIEKGWKSDSLRYVLEENCFGGFYESGLGKPVKLSTGLGICTDPSKTEDALHAGSTLMLYDKDNDGDKELVLGDLSFSNFNMLTNGGNKNKAWFSAQDNDFPSNSLAVDIPIFPVPFYLDCNNDGKKDLLGAPNSPKAALDHDVLWYYPNVGTAKVPVFEYKQKNLLIEDMIDIGSGANPSLVDVNADGLLDLILGVNFTYKLFGNTETRLMYYQNKGTKTNPIFELIDDNYLDFKQFSSVTSGLTPTFGDIDADGDLDLLVGEEYGTLFFVKNIAGKNLPLKFGAIEIEYNAIDAGLSSTPFIADINKDGINDILVGNRSGDFKYYQNNGVKNSPIFSDKATLPNFGKVNTKETKAVSGFSAPVFMDFGNQQLLISGSEKGKMYQFTIPKDSLKGTFTKVTDNFGDITEGNFTRPAFADLDGDNILEMVVGNFRGGIAMFKTNLKTDGSVPNRETTFKHDINVFPNPVSDVLQLENAIGFDLKIFNINGQLLKSYQNLDSQYIDIQELNNGILIFNFEKETLKIVKKVVKM
jgi:hypothetical protein